MAVGHFKSSQSLEENSGVGSPLRNAVAISPT